MHFHDNLYVIAFDFGTKSIGVAGVNLAAKVKGSDCNELQPLKAREGIPSWDEIQALLDEWKPRKVVVGLPFDSDGKDMEITRRARKFGNRLRSRFQCDVDFIDETLSTKAAKQEAHDRGQGNNYSRQPVDSIAARLILESWLEQHL